INANLEVILQRIQRACRTAGRDPDEVKLLLATKTVSPENIRIAMQAGQTLIGENKVQEVRDKYEALKEVPHQKHFIGHLQTNKIKDILKYGVTCIESLDRLELAEKLHQRLHYENRRMDVFVQVNTSGEASKFGISPDKAIELIRQIAAFDTISIKGLMTIGLFSAEADDVRKCFQVLKNLQIEVSGLEIPGVEMK